ncbi:DUF4352 domain-containing protein [Mycobacterium hackensackense]|uniref:DUF2510 domain-containing protein n=1 Tax=Mycobacterium hackensackense TaxID=228909 RepID=UPI0022659440|nr:DUF2510 domain-containing protein [Mycobacterium hackensackense]MCV7252399.1 DUF4352 domain-containing protein [Mycobacterium hackensackense]
MTTPPTPAGWYPDPDGTGGQRYWDGTAWTEHLTPAQAPPAPPVPAAPAEPSAPQEPTSWPSELPPWPDVEMPSWEQAASEQPTAVVNIPQPEQPAPEPSPSEPESDADTPEPAEEAPEPSPENPEPPTAFEPDTTVVRLPEPATTVVPTYTPASFYGEPAAAQFAEPAAAAPGPTAPAAGNGKLLKSYIGGVGVLLIALIAALVYALVIHKPEASRLSLPGATSTQTTSSSAETSTETSRPSATESAPAAPAAGSAVDGDVTFTQNGIDIGPTVVAPDNDQLTKTATGEFIVVHLTLTNTGQAPATFVADQQVLTADGQTYTPDTEATFYLGGTTTVVYPNEPVDVAIAFDVPPGSVPGSLQVHGDVSSAGAVLPLS